ncbi:MAG: hypothetical protein KDA43_14765 [Hyphomonas sp.]|nr:hypothetical protein [Hyphomonas sp.]
MLKHRTSGLTHSNLRSRNFRDQIAHVVAEAPPGHMILICSPNARILTPGKDSEARTLPTDISQPGPWYGVPREQVRQRFAEFLKGSDFPEEFPGVACDAKPPKDRDFTIIHKDVTVDPTRRQRLSTDPDSPTDCYLPCNLCGPAPQFKNCGYAIVCDLGHVFFVGSICAAKHYEGRFSDAIRDYDREAAERRAQTYFSEHSDRIPAIAAHARRLLAIAESYAPAHKEIRRLPTFRKAMRHGITVHGGWLQLRRLEKRLTPEGIPYSHETNENFARISGEPATRGQFSFDSTLRDYVKLLDGFGDDENAVLEAIVSAHDKGKLPELHMATQKAILAVNQTRDGLAQFRVFFQQGNLENIQRWLRQRDCDVTCRAENDGRVWWFRVYGTDKRRPIDTRVFDAPVPKAPA